MADDLRDVVSQTLAAPLGDVIASVGRGVAEAQAALDRGALEETIALYTQQGDEGAALLREIGYRPTYYALPETTCEVQVALSIAGSGGADGGARAPAGFGRARTYVTPLDASFVNRFNFVGTASARLSFRIVPVPPPAALDDARPVPRLAQLTVADAARLLAALGFEARFVKGGQAIDPAASAESEVVRQDPPPLALRPPGSAVTVMLD